jgi:TonB family protein
LAGIFVSYRRSDSQGEAGRLFDDLVKHFGEDKVFMDVAAIEAGRDFRKAIEEGVTKCGVLLVVMGPEWVTAKNESGTRRLDDLADFVRIETASALKRDIPVIPVLVRGTKMPTADQLPDDLKELAYRNAIELTHARWRSDIQLLTDALRRLVGDASPTGITPSVVSPPSSLGRSAVGHNSAESTQPQTNSIAFDPAELQRISRQLALHIGPIADIVVKRAASSCTSLQDLYVKVAGEIDSTEAREKFLLGRISPTSTPPPDVAAPATSQPKKAPEPSKAAESSAVGMPARTKYVLLASGAGILLVLMFVLVPRSAQSGGDSANHPVQTAVQPIQAPAQESRVPEPTPAASPMASPAPAAPRVASESPQLRVPMEVEQALAISRVPPTYPPLAREARIQGMVIFDADIAKDGSVEALRVVSGHPLLVPAAIAAVKQWRYKPYVLRGVPVTISTQIPVMFTLENK